ncbi:hypothetical protein [Calothrix sp. PCC 7507]|uniref:hypothetical protein n=1 Tax=Calothrix sp. PCC 7507 TaxID=99598 RepID=UPI00029F4BAF|nr:hypothetical protein [Calothrix sp. PCC 7507]AFY33595.1 protein of unknown function Spy-related protein [Calothrix sp. PCC 7507]
MSSGSSGRYQSKLFNFVHQQSRRLTQQWEHTFRHVQVATKWGVELLLYPVYMLLQSGESATKKLHTKEPQSKLQLEPETPPTADTPIQQVLEAIKNLPSAESPTTSPRLNPLAFLGSLWRKFSHHRPSQSLTILKEPAGSLHPSQPENSLKLNHLVVQGIATSLVNRHLVLVTTDNAILDILTPQQQAKLEERIITEIANYWRAWRLFEANKKTAILPEIERLLIKLTGTNPNHIHSLPPGMATEELDPRYLFKYDKVLGFIDTVVAKLESKALVPVQQRSREIIQVAHTQFSIFLYGKEQLVARGQIAVTADGLETHPLNIQALIAAALNYFFGVSTDKNLESKDSHRKISGKRLSLPRNSQLQNEVLDPWLSWSDLFGESKTPVKKPDLPTKRENPALIPSASAANSLPKKGNYQNLLQPPQPGGLVQQKKPNRNLTPKQNISQKVTADKETTSRISQSGSKSHKGEISQQRRQSAEMEAQPDWIEVKATNMGYDKHLLEQLLELLDSAMLWLEEIFVKIFQVLQQLWQGK